MRTLIIGYGQIGEGLYKVLSKTYKVKVFDLKKETPDDLKIRNKDIDNGFDILHICIPPVEGYENSIKNYIKIFEPKYTVIHSTFPMGTAKRLGCFHSPVRGIHPNLDKGIKTFVKYLAPKNQYVTQYFTRAGIKIQEVADTNTTEALKLWDTTIYGVNIALEKEIYDWCQKNKVDYDMVYTDSCRTYNQGYQLLGHPEYKKYILKHIEGEIGGHCVMNNLKLLDSPISRLLQKTNAKYKLSKMSKTSRQSR